MNKAELIEALAQHYEGSKVEATKALNAVVQTITYTAAAGEKVAITGFGVFEKIDRPARIVRNPRTGERKEAAATSVPRFRPGTELKAYVAGDRPLPDGSTPVSAPVRRTRSRSATAATAPPPAEPAPVADVEQPAVKTASKSKATKPAATKPPASKAAATKPPASKAAASKVEGRKDSKAKKDTKSKDSKGKDSKSKKKDGKKSK